MKPSAIVFSLAAASLLAACGNKGPLFLPPRPPVGQDVPATPVTPAEEKAKKNEAPPIDPASDVPPPAEPAPPVPEEED